MALRNITSLFILSLLLMTGAVSAQTDTARWTVPAAKTYSFVRQQENVIRQSENLNPLLEKLYDCKNNHQRTVRIVHIGDSHLQAGMITAVLRNGFQQFFGNAGRGLVFPYQLAKSNAPSDIVASSNTTWQYSRLAHPEINVVTGISGFGIHSTTPGAEVSMQLKPGPDSLPDFFNKLTFFLGNDTDCYKLSAPGLAKPLFGTNKPGGHTSITYTTDTGIDGFELSKCNANSSDEFALYGVSLERSNTPGVIYHTIGVNGAQYEQYLRNDLFWNQLEALDGDLFIVSMGTNEAQNMQFDAGKFLTICDSFVGQIHKIAPHAVILLTTPAGSYFKQKAPNRIIPLVSDALVLFCKQEHLPYWDLFSVSSGLAGTKAWRQHNLFSHDFVHYNKEGYELQGTLLLNALATAYNNYVKHHPAAQQQTTRKERSGSNQTKNKHQTSTSTDTLISNPTKKHVIKTEDR